MEQKKEALNQSVERQRENPQSHQKNDYLQQESKLIRRLFDLDEILKFQETHDIQIIRGADFVYQAWIDKVAYGTSLTPMGSLVFGIKSYGDAQK